MNTYISVDENKKVTSVLYSEVPQEGFLQLTSNIPESGDEGLTLFYNEKTGHCYFDKEPEPDKTELELLAEENTDLKSRLSTLEDTIMVLTMF